MDFVLNDKQLGYWSSTEFNNQMMYAYNSKVTEKVSRKLEPISLLERHIFVLLLLLNELI